MTHTTHIAAVDFHGQSLTVITGPNGEHLVAMKPICEGIGLGWQSQYNRIKRHPVLSTSIFIMNTQMPGDDQQREVTCLPLDMLNGWLFSVDASRVRPEIRDTLIQYQRECFAALAAYWQQGEAANPRKTRKPKALPNGLTLEQQEAVKSLVKARVETLPANRRAKAAITCWSALKSKFGCTYKEIPPEQFTDAVSLVARVALEGELLTSDDELGGGRTVLNDQQLYAVFCLRSHFQELNNIFEQFNLYRSLRSMGSPVGAHMLGHFSDAKMSLFYLRDLDGEFDSVQRRLGVNEYRHCMP